MAVQDLEHLAFQILENEGLSYAITNYFDEKEVRNWDNVPEEVKEAWFRAKRDLKIVEDFFWDHLR